MPYGVPSSSGSSTSSQTIEAAEDIVVTGQEVAFVRIAMDGPTLKVYKADSSLGTGYQADGYITANVDAGDDATVYFDGLVTTGGSLTPGANIYLSTAGAYTQAAPGVGDFTQKLGWAVTDTVTLIEIEDPIFP